MKLFLKLSVLAIAGIALLSFWAPATSAIDLFPDSTCSGKAADSAACSGSGDDNISGANGVIARATKLLAIVGGIAAVITLIVGGFLLITAGGDSGRVSSGRKTITYALIGIVVIALARTIIVFVVSRV